MLTVLGFCNRNIGRIIASDISSEMVCAAAANLALLTQKGLKQRRRELDNLLRQYQKTSHREALESLERLKASLSQDIPSTLYTADCTRSLPLEDTPDIIMTDVPYGNLVAWEGSGENPLQAMYLQLSRIARPDTVLAVIMDKKQKYQGDAWIRREKQLVGKRKFEIYRLGA